MPLQKRMPKYGFTSRVARSTDEVRLSELHQVSGDIVDLESLKKAGLVGTKIARVRVFLSGSISRPLTVKGVAVTKGARQAIEAAGGSVED
jgi:large subunit ribosomal protein L15